MQVTTALGGVCALLVIACFMAYFNPYTFPTTTTTKLQASCQSLKTPTTCDANAKCVWCVSFAIPSACYDLKDAAGLPDGVFECHKKQVEAPTCNAYKTQTKCNEVDECTWCESFAIPSKCYSTQDAANLPSGVFNCDAKQQQQQPSALHAQVTFTTLVEHDNAVASGVEPLCDKKVKQISGYFQIGNSDQHYFFWFFESRSKPSTDPVVLWLTGGPGCASELALFAENGPCTLDAEGKDTVNNPHSWNSNANLLYVDQPTGTGFSYGSNRAAAREEKAVAQDLYLFINAFLTKYSQYQRSKFFLFGESYAGHYVPAAAHRIWLGNKRNEFKMKINLRGVSVGNGMTNPQVQFPLFPQMAYNSTFAPSVVSKAQYKMMQASVPLCVKMIQLCNQFGGLSCRTALQYCEANLIAPVSLLGYNLYDMRLKCAKPPLCYDFSNIGVFLNRPEVRAQLGVPAHVKPWEECSAKVSSRFVKDWMHNFHHKLPDLLEDGIPVLIYVGDQDYICNWMGNKAWALDLKWSKQKQFVSAKDLDWNKGKGRIRSAGPFSFLQVYKAGHMVPMDQPEASLKMLNDFIQGKGAWGSSEEGEVKVETS